MYINCDKITVKLDSFQEILEACYIDYFVQDWDIYEVC